MNMRMMRSVASAIKALAVVFLGVALFGCATFDHQADQARTLIRNRKTDQVLAQYKEKAWKESDDQLVYLFDYGMAAHIAGNYEESNRALIMADKLSEVKDYHSLSRIAGSLLLNEGMVQYKGDDYEKVIVNAVLALNFLMLGDYDAALVETRKINSKLYHYKFEAKRPYEQNPFAYYLAGMIWETDRKFDDSYIDYKKAYELFPQYAPLKEDLMRLAAASGREEDLKKWQEQFPEVKPKPEWKDKKYGELVFIYQQGWGPRKRPDPESPRLPKLFPIYSHTDKAKVIVEGAGESKTEFLYSVEATAIKTLTDQYAALVAKRVAGIATKAVVADQIRQKNETLGQLAWIGMNLADRADTRQWSTLPETFQIARMYLPGGTYKVRAEGLSDQGASSGENMDLIEVKVKPGKKTFVTWRSVR